MKLLYFNKYMAIYGLQEMLNQLVNINSSHVTSKINSDVPL